MQGKVTLKDSAAIEAYAGIDVCKRWLDIAIHPYGHCERFENTGKGIKKLMRWLSSYDVELIISAKQAAMLAGLAPVACESGESKGARHIRGGRASVRRARRTRQACRRSPACV